MEAKSLKNKAIAFRLRGKTFSDINKLLNKNISKSTLSAWFHDIKLTDFYNKKLEKNIAAKLKRSQRKAKEINRKRRLEYLDNLRKRNLYLTTSISISTQKMILSTLYLAEGAKHKNTPALTLGSSNPDIIIFYLKLLKNCYSVSLDKFRVRIQCRADQNISRLERFWQKTTRIPKKQFYPTYIDKRTIGKTTLKPEYKGVCVITYFSTEIQLELELLADSMIKSSALGPVVQW
ncbi:hypothetical protein HYS03_02650 [Candidatus Woesebacteria bacterium]|nr:hypothetical protein [Candidatus Woesebacteria bacterium]